MLVSLEGNIGVGKSTVLNILTQRGFKVHQEGLDSWKTVVDSQNQTIFDYFYRDPAKYGFAFQMVILAQRAEQTKQLLSENTGVVLIERSNQSTEIFRRTLPLDEIEHAAFDYVFPRIDTERQCNIRYIHLVASPSECLARIQNRGRQEEQGITLEYLEKIDTSYKQFFERTEHVAVSAHSDPN